MKTYAALAAASHLHKAILEGSAYPHVLVSFHYDRKTKVPLIDKFDYDPQNLMLDSGAFSVSGLGAEISLPEYIEWVKKLADRYPAVRVTNLDVIPKRENGQPIKAEISKAIRQGHKNADWIREQGLRVIEVYHLFEPLDTWRKMIERRQEGEVLGLGGLGSSAWGDLSVRQAFGDAAFAVVREMCGWDAVPPIHAFGVVSSDIAWRYPLASCDASSWLSPVRWGQTVRRNGKLARPEKAHRTNRNEHGIRECIKMLTGWQERDRQIEAHWRQRGVTILPEGPAYVCEPVA